MNLLSVLIGIGKAAALLLDLWDGTIAYTGTNGFTTYARMQHNSDGRQYKNSGWADTGTGVDLGAWVVNGNPASYWIERTIDSGTLQIDEIGNGREPMTSSYRTGVSAFNGGNNGTTVTATVTFRLYDAASGGNLVSTGVVNFSATEDTL